jgi:putative component of membrane protein insertase Oxa1/YidC/SpoIIIJ protein YidD
MTRLMMILIMSMTLYKYWFPCRGHQNRMQPDCSIYIWEALLLLARGSLHWLVAQYHYSGQTG